MAWYGRKVRAQIVAGQDETGGDPHFAVHDILATDKILAVIMLTAGEVMADIREDFYPGAGVITATNLRDATGDSYLVIWEDLT